MDRPHHGEDFCLLHGREHMREEIGNPIPYCAKCDKTVSEVGAADHYIAEQRAEIERLRAALVKAEAVMSIVEPRSDKREYLETLFDVREALGLDRKTGSVPVSS